MRKYLISIFCISFLFVSYSQDKVFNLEDLFKSNKLYADNLRQLQWISKSHDFVYVENNILMKQNVKQNHATEFISLSDINKALQAVEIEDLSNFPVIQKWVSNKEFCFRWKNILFYYHVEKKTIEKQIAIDKSGKNLEIDFSNSQAAYTIDNNLFVVTANQKPVQVNQETPEGVKFGHVVHRNEFGVNQGSFWSPQGNFLAFYRMDESMVANYPLVNTSTRIATLENEKYPMAGETSHQVTLGVYNMKNKEIVYMQTGEPNDQYLSAVTWSPDEKFIFIVVLNRDQNHLKFNQYDAKTGVFVKTLFEEKNERYVEPYHPVYFVPNNPNQFVWSSRRDGWNHLYLYDISGKLIKQLTSGKWEVKKIAAFNHTGKQLYFYSNKDEIVGNHFYSVQLSNSKINRISTDLGVHN
ncbi:MAG: S9 family peptidase, partial [Bacteroidales bacterium]|nr:S9 family peptidase [Bacteroidales bacterium]